MNFFRKLIVIIMFCGQLAHAQQAVSGLVLSKDSIPVSGANISIPGNAQPLTTGANGIFSGSTDAPYPITLKVSHISYKDAEFTVAGPSPVTFTLEEKNSGLDEIVVLATRTEERIIESPVSIEQLTLKDIRQSSSADFFDELSKLKGVHTNRGSLTFTSINTRGFATIANSRFLTLMDGIDMAAPLLNFPTGNVMGLPELDVKSVELVPGASSALYGPNAYNGTLLMNSKSPFDFSGFSLVSKAGFTSSEEGGTHPLFVNGLRIAQVFKKNWAIKVNFSALNGTDWSANDYTTDKQTGTDRVGAPDFDGLNLYGDDRLISLPISRFKTVLVNGLAPLYAGYYGGDLNATKAALSHQLDTIPSINVRRTGIEEGLQLDNQKATSIKAGFGVYKKWDKGVVASADYRIGMGNTVYFGSDRFMFRNFTQQFFRGEVKNDFFNIMGYASSSGFGNSYNVAAIGGLANEAFTATSVWAPQYLQTYVNTLLKTAYQELGGSVGALNTDDLSQAHIAARQFADRNIPLPGTDSFNAVIDRVRNGYFQKGGARFTDESWRYFTEFNLDLSKFTGKWLDIQVGANYKYFNLSTNGTIYNEDPDGDGTIERVRIWEVGGFLQLHRRLINDRLRLTASVRFDKNQNFKGQATPRVAVVYAAGKKKEHFIRTSFQTGFRIPETQAQYIYFPSASILLGGIEENASRYGLFEGGAILKSDWDKYLATRDTSNLRSTYLNYVKPERLSAVEIGYRAVLWSKLTIDVNAHYTAYRDFQTQVLVYNIDSTYHKGRMLPGIKQSLANPTVSPTLWSPYTNLDGRIHAWGVNFGWSYRFWKSFSFTGNYSYIDYKAPANFTERDVAFNTPQNRFELGIEAPAAYKNLGFSVGYRWQQAFLWSSTFGQGNIDAFGTLNVQLNYTVPKLMSTFKISADNLAAQSYRTNYGGPFVGTTFLVSWVFNQPF